MTEQEPETFAGQQLANARSDPRLQRDEKAMVADWREGVEALERVRGFAIFSITEVHRSLEGHDAIPRGDDQLEHVLWQRRQLAAAEIASNFAELNAMTLVGLLGALDSLVESLAPAAREMLVAVTLSERLEELRRDQPEVVAAVAEETIEAVREAAIPVFLKQLGKIAHARGGGAERWEEVLRHAHLQAPAERPIPTDMDLALVEIVALRHVLVHNAARVDDRALENAPSLPWGVGQLVRIDSDGYRRYSAAIRTFGDEVVWRVLSGVELPPPNLGRWDENYVIGT